MLRSLIFFFYHLSLVAILYQERGFIRIQTVFFHVREHLNLFKRPASKKLPLYSLKFYCPPFRLIQLEITE